MDRPSPPRVLITGFEPFDGDSVNPSWEVAHALEGWRCETAAGVLAEVVAVRFSCVFGRAIEQLDAALERWQPTLVVSLGLAAGRAEITPERVAINLDDARIGDNAGNQPVDVAVVPDAPVGYFSTLPIKAIVRDLRAAGLPASVSNTAGTFVCNHVFYGLMNRLATRPALAGARGGFVHLPCLPEQAARLPGTPCMALADQVRGIKTLVATSLAVAEDIRETGGQLH